MGLKRHGCLLSGWKMQSPQMLISGDDKQGEQIYWLQYIVRDIYQIYWLLYIIYAIYSIYRFQMLISGDDKQGGQIYWQRCAFIMLVTRWRCLWRDDDDVVNSGNTVYYTFNTSCANQIVCKNLRIVAQWWILSESHLLRLYFSVFHQWS